MLHEQGVSCHDIFDNRKRYLKRFIESINNLNNKEDLVLCQQLLDFVLEDILIPKKTYEKLK